MEFQRKKKTKPDKLTRQLCLSILLRKGTSLYDKKATIITLTPYRQTPSAKFPFPSSIHLDHMKYCSFFEISPSTLYRDLNDLSLFGYYNNRKDFGSYYSITHSKKDQFLENSRRLYDIYRMYLDHYDAIDAYICGVTTSLYQCPAGFFLLEKITTYPKLTASCWCENETSPSACRRIQRDFKVLKEAAKLLHDHPESF